MPRRERFIAYIVCPKCEREGAAIWEESEEPVYRRGEWDTTLTRVSDGFVTGRKGKILCLACNVEVVVRQNRKKT